MSSMRRVPLSAFDFESREPVYRGGLGNLYLGKAKATYSKDLYVGVKYLVKTLRGTFSSEEKSQYYFNLEQVWGLLGPNRHHYRSRIAIPLAIVEKDPGIPVGFAVKEFKSGCEYILNGVNGPIKAPQDFKIFMNSREQRESFGTPFLSLWETLKVIGDMFQTLGQLHDRGIVVGDISHSNCLVQREKNKLRTIFLDFDSFCTLDGPHPLGLQTSHLYLAPEEYDALFRQATFATDTYKSALICIRLLSQKTEFQEDSFTMTSIGTCEPLLVKFGGHAMVRLIQRALSETPEERPSMTLLAKVWNEELSFLEGSDQLLDFSKESLGEL